MKNVFFAALLVLSTTASVFATPVEQVSSNVLYHFKSNFKEASQVSWFVAKDFVKASFILNNDKMSVFYNSEGYMIATTKSISLENLPTYAKRYFAKRYEGYIVKEAIRFDGIEENAYYISAEKEKKEVVLKIADNEVSIYKQSQK